MILKARKDSEFAIKGRKDSDIGNKNRKDSAQTKTSSESAARLISTNRTLNTTPITDSLNKSDTQ